MKLLLTLSAFALLFCCPMAFAADASGAYYDLEDSPSITVDWSKSATQFVTLHGNRTLVFVNGKKGKHYTLAISQDSTGSRTVTWPSSVRWQGLSGPILTTTGGKTDYIGFINNGVSYDLLAFSQGY